MHGLLRTLILAIFLLSLCLCQSKDNYILDHQKIIQQDFEYSFGGGWQFNWNVNNTPHRIFGQSIPQNFDGSNPYLSELAAREFISSNQ